MSITDVPLFEVPAEPVPDDGDGFAFLTQFPAGDRRRGWSLVVTIPGEEARRQHLSRPGLRPPTLAARAEALGTLGVRLAERRWHWTEEDLGDGSVILTAMARVCRYPGGEDAR